MAAAAKVAATAHGVRCSTAMAATAMSSSASRPSIGSARENGHHHYSEKEFKLCHGTLRTTRR
jgi:hypothetical protein